LRVDSTQAARPSISARWTAGIAQSLPAMD
jgi:hypothetical protein